MQWKPKQVILRVYFMYTVNEMRLGELAETVLHREHPTAPRKDFWSFLITPFPPLTEMSSSLNSPLYHPMTSENQEVAPCKQILVPESIREIVLVETGITLVIGIQYLVSRNWSGHPRSTVMEIEIHSMEFNMSWIG